MLLNKNKLECVKNLQETIEIHPKHMTPRLGHEMKSILTNQMKKKCDREHGYMHKIDTINHFKCDKIASNCYGIYNVTYDASFIKPVVGETYSCTFLFDFDEGFFVNVDGFFKIMVIHNNKKMKMRESVMSIKILKMQFTNSEFQCIGEYIEK